jgi:phosphatidylglycerophosphatase C
MKRLALFDVDGTLTRRDTMFLFLRHARGPLGAALAVLLASPWMALHLVKLVSAQSAKEVLLRRGLGGVPRAELDAAAATFADVIDQDLRDGALDRLREHQQQGDDVLLVSASLDTWLAPWARRHGLRLLATPARHEGAGGGFAGLGGVNNTGPQKVVRIREVVDPAAYEHVVGYGDSSGDREMLALCHEAHYRPFRG